MHFKYGQKETEFLKHQDQRLGKAIDRIGMIHREVTPDLFYALANAIVGQQISGKAAETVWGRILARYQKVTPDRILSQSVDTLQQCGMSMKKASYIHQIATAIREGSLDLEGIRALSDDDLRKALTKLPGIGPWTADMLMIFALQRTDILSYEDFGIRKGILTLYDLPELDKKQFAGYRERFSPYGTVASFYLWELAGGK